jgi:hypothetical protein
MRTIPTDRPQRWTPSFSANFCGQRDVAWLARQSPMAVNLAFPRPEPLISLSYSSSFILMKLSGPRSRPTAAQKIWTARNRTRDLWDCSQKFTTRPQRRSALTYYGNALINRRRRSVYGQFGTEGSLCHLLENLSDKSLIYTLLRASLLFSGSRKGRLKLCN